MLSMPRRGLVLCSSLFFIVFLMCPKRIRTAFPDQQKYIHAIKRSPNALTDANAHIRRTEWANEQLINIIKLDGKPLKDNKDEPGSEFSEEHIVRYKLWPKGMIPYYIDTEHFSDKVLRDRIRLFLNTVNSLTMLRFEELPSIPGIIESTRYVLFSNPQRQMGCFDYSSTDFNDTGVQHVYFGYDCLSSGQGLAAAVLAIAGVPPQHNSPNRDKYIKIVEENIISDKKEKFKKLGEENWPFTINFYDYQSAGHFDHHKYSLNGKATIQVQDGKRKQTLGETHKFTRTDIKKLRVLYNSIVKKEMKEVPECAKLFRKRDNP